MSRTSSLLKTMLAGATLAVGIVGMSQVALAQGKGLDEPFREGYYAKLKGKVVAYLPVAMSFDLAQGWLQGLNKELEPLGVKIEVRDPNWSTNAGAQALTTLIGEKPDVIIGTLLIGTMLNGMTILDVSYAAQNLVKGVILLVAILADSFLNPRNEETAQQGDI
jgi:hypothetical protein